MTPDGRLKLVSELPDGPPNGYPSPLVDHAEERRTALERYADVRR